MKLLIFLIVVCFFTQQKNPVHFTPTQSLCDSFTREVPRHKKTGQEHVLQKEISGYTEILNLNNIETGFDSFQIHILFNYGLYKWEQLLVIKKEDSGWSGTLFEIKVGYKDGNVDIEEKKEKEVHPKSGWKKCMEKLFANNLLTLPDEIDIPGNNIGGGDRPMVLVEFALKCHYKFYCYIDPKLYSNKNTFSRKMNNLIIMMENEFEFKRLVPDKSKSKGEVIEE